MLIICDKHENRRFLKISEDLKIKFENKAEIDTVVGIFYESYEQKDKKYIRYLFSKEEAEKHNIPVPGIVLEFIYAHYDRKKKDNNPYREAMKSAKIVCLSCFEEIYKDLMAELESKYENFKRIDLGFYFPW